MSKVYDFLQENNMLSESFDRQQLAAEFSESLKTGKNLCITNSFQKVFSGELPKERILAIDAGGTNLRFALCENGIIGEEHKMPMFGVKEEIEVEDFFKCMASEINKYDVDKVGLCFSYPCDIQSNRDGRIIELTKEVKVRNAHGRLLGEGINKYLDKPRMFSVLNDTVAAQLGVSADVGIILGTGFNICYTNKKTGTIYVTECGQYDKMPQGTFDKILCKEMDSPRTSSEKQISGAYLGQLIQITARAYFRRDLPDFQLSDVSEFLIGEGILYDFFSSSEKVEFREIISLLLKRAANRVAIMLECVLEDYTHAVVALEGSTVYKLPGYFDVLRHEVRKIEDKKIEFADARGALMEGCVRSIM